MRDPFRRTDCEHGPLSTPPFLESPVTHANKTSFWLKLGPFSGLVPLERGTRDRQGGDVHNRTFRLRMLGM
jgi:hypothetical protein